MSFATVVDATTCGGADVGKCTLAFLAARLTALFFQALTLLGLEPLQAQRALLEAQPCVAGGVASDQVRGEARLRRAKSLDEWNLTGAHIVAATAFDAVHESVAFQPRKVHCARVHVELLWEQECGADFRAVAAANARHLRLARL